jgi:hypothetical protein
MAEDLPFGVKSSSSSPVTPALHLSELCRLVASSILAGVQRTYKRLLKRSSIALMQYSVKGAAGSTSPVIGHGIMNLCS